jgi:hypothetical protein
LRNFFLRRNGYKKRKGRRSYIGGPGGSGSPFGIAEPPPLGSIGSKTGIFQELKLTFSNTAATPPKSSTASTNTTTISFLIHLHLPTNI